MAACWSAPIGHAEDSDARVVGSSADGEPAVPIATHIAIRTSEGQTKARVTLVYPDSGHEMTSWGQVHREGNLFRVEVAASRTSEGSFLPVLQEFSHTYALGNLAPGHYAFAVFSAGHRLGVQGFRVAEPTPEPPVPAKVHLAVHIENAGVAAVASVLFTEPGWEIADWGQAVRHGSSFTIGATAARVAYIPLLPEGEEGGPLPDPVAEARHKYSLGVLEPGEYQLTFLLNGGDAAHRRFFVSSGEEGRVVLHAPPVTEPNQARQRLHVTYRHASGVDAASLDDHDIRVKGPEGYDRLARFIGIVEPIASTETNAVRAVYEVLPPGHHWTSRDNGHYTVHLLSHAVQAGDGSYFAAQPLGGFVVDVPRSEVPLAQLGSVKIVEHDSPEGLVYGARLTILIGASNIGVTSWGSVHREGNRFAVNVILDYLAEVGAPVVREESHTYPLGRLEPGEYVFNLFSRGHFMGRAVFRIEGDAQDGPIARVFARDLTEPREHPQPFQIRFRSSHGMNLESIREAPVMVVGPHDYKHRARLVRLDTYHLEDGREFAQAAYLAPAPDHGWTSHANGSYGIFVPHDAIFDQAGHSLEGGRIGGFRVAISPPQIHPERPRIEFSTYEEEGRVFAKVEFHPGDSPLIATHWGDLRLKGHDFVAPVNIIDGRHVDVAPQPSHTYSLGHLAPGVYGFVVHSLNRNFSSRHVFTVGADDDVSPHAQWEIAMRELALVRGDDGGVQEGDRLMDYAFGLDSAREGRTGILEPDVARDRAGRPLLVVRHRWVPGASDLAYRIEASRDLVEWVDVTERVQRLESGSRTDGGHWRSVELPAEGDEPYRFARVRVVPRDQE
jgi:hypothetical protein